MIETWVEVGNQSIFAGTLHTHLRRGRLSSTFEYETEYLQRTDAYGLEPALALSAGTWPNDLELPRSFSDAAPDRWGRNLIARRYRHEQSKASGSIRQLTDIDYLLGVSDYSRQGALRFKTPNSSEFESAFHDVPKLIALPRLLRAAEHISRDEQGSYESVKILLDAGTASLGGTRPKATVVAEQRLSIAKFPHHQDSWNVIAWEKVALDLAADAGIQVPNSQLLLVGDSDVLVIERFDRIGESRVGYISAMTLMVAQDGESHDYLELAEHIAAHSISPSRDLHELWRRIAFSVAINNTDDHLRNHGFLRFGNGWQLSPIFDVNPNPDAAQLRQTTIGGAATVSQEIGALLSHAQYFDLTLGRAKRILAEVIASVRGWREAATVHRIPKEQQQQFESMFRQRLELLELALTDSIED